MGDGESKMAERPWEFDPSMGSLRWEFQYGGSSLWRPLNMAEAFVYERAFEANKTSATFGLQLWKDYYGSECPSRRDNDPATLTWSIDFRTMIRTCDQDPGRRIKIRRVDRDIALLPTQCAALVAVDKAVGKGNGKDKNDELAVRLSRLGLSKYPASHWLCNDALKYWFANEAPLIVHIKFEKQFGGGKLLVDCLLEDDRLRNLFEVKHGCGSEDTKHRNGWEKRLFDGAYEDAPPQERPVYGTVNLTNMPGGVGACAQYGRSYLVLKNSLRWRTTMADRDSSSPDANAAFLGSCANFLARFDNKALKAICEHTGGLEMQIYPEIQIHGGVLFARDIDSVVMHGSLEGGVQSKVRNFCARWELPLSLTA